MLSTTARGVKMHGAWPGVVVPTTAVPGHVRCHLVPCTPISTRPISCTRERPIIPTHHMSSDGFSSNSPLQNINFV